MEVSQPLRTTYLIPDHFLCLHWLLTWGNTFCTFLTHLIQSLILFDVMNASFKDYRFTEPDLNLIIRDSLESLHSYATLQLSPKCWPNWAEFLHKLSWQSIIQPFLFKIILFSILLNWHQIWCKHQTILHKWSHKFYWIDKSANGSMVVNWHNIVSFDITKQGFTAWTQFETKEKIGSLEDGWRPIWQQEIQCKGNLQLRWSPKLRWLT